MPHSVLGWLRAGLPGRPVQDKHKGKSGARHKVAAPPAGGAGTVHPPCSAADRPPADREDASPDSSGSGHAIGKAAAVEPGRALGVAAVLSGARNWGFLLKALTLHSANLAASLAARPLAPLQARLQAQLAEMEAVQGACRQLGVNSLAELQDLMNCVILSEHVYKIVDHPTDVSVSLINRVKAQFPPHLATLRTVQWAQAHVRHRFLLGESDDALYVSFMGTKLPRDMATNANLFQEEVVLDAAMLSSGASAELGGEGAAAAAVGAGRGPLAAHRGFLARARSIPVQQLYQEARARGKRLVLCGHSLGGAVASLCAIKLLQHLPPNLYHTVSCYGFATPALGNDALASTVEEAGWHTRIRNYINPDDPIPGLLSFRRQPEKAGPAESSSSSAEPTSASDTVAAAPTALSTVASSSSALAAAGPAAAAPSLVPAAANNIQAAPRLSAGAAAGARQRLSRIAGHVGGSSSGLDTPAAAERAEGSQAEQVPPPLANTSRGPGSPLGRSSSAPTLLPSDAVAAVEEHTAAAVIAAAAAESGLAAAGSDNIGSGGKPGGPQHWLGQRLAAAAAPPLRRAGSAALAAAAPPMRAVVERAGSAARLVAMPLSAAASVPMRAAPQYLPIGRQLFILPSSVSTTKPPATQALPPPAASLTAAAVRPWPPPLFRRSQAAAAGANTTSSHDEEVEDNVDVAAAATLAVAGSASLEGEDGAGGAAASGGGRRRRRGVFEAHRMATYRKRLLDICQASLEGHLMVRSLPMLPNLPRPGDVAASQLLAPPMFPLRAVATLKEPAFEVAEAAAVPAAAGSGGTPVGHAGSAAKAAAPGATPARGSSDSDVAGGSAQPEAGPGRFRPLAFWARLLAHATGQQRRRQEAPLELLIRVEGRGLANVTQAWIEGIPPAAEQGAPALGAGSKDGGSSARGSEAPVAATVAQVEILQQPQAALLPPPLQGRPQLPVVGQLSAFVSWVAATLGWVAILRQLQPAGRSDFLIARVRLPASAVRDAQRAAENSLLTSVADGPLLHGLHLGPRLSLRLQSDFSSQSLPLDIRVGADLAGQHAQHGWQWPWRRRRPAPQAQQQQGPSRRRQRQAKQTATAQQQQPSSGQQHLQRWWWDWPGDTTAAGGH